MESPVDMVEVAEEIRAQAYADALKGIPTDALLEEIRRRCEQVKHLSEVML